MILEYEVYFSGISHKNLFIVLFEDKIASNILLFWPLNGISNYYKIARLGF